MKKTLFLAFGLSCAISFAQEGRVGINTENPQATLNIKTHNDTKNPKSIELENQSGTKLLTALNNGNIGINTENPQEKLHIEGKIKIVDGTQGEGKVLTSDANGTASWTTPVTSASIKRVKGVTIDCSNVHLYILPELYIRCVDNVLYSYGAHFYVESDNRYISSVHSNFNIKDNKFIIPENIKTDITYKVTHTSYENLTFFIPNKVLYIGE